METKKEKAKSKMTETKCGQFEICDFCEWKRKMRDDVCEECNSLEMVNLESYAGHEFPLKYSPDLKAGLPASIGFSGYCRICANTIGSVTCQKCISTFKKVLPTQYLDLKALERQKQRVKEAKEKSNKPNVVVEHWSNISSIKCNEKEMNDIRLDSFLVNIIEGIKKYGFEGVTFNEILEALGNLKEQFESSKKMSRREADQVFYKDLYEHMAIRYANLLENVNTLDIKIRDLTKYHSDVLTLNLAEFNSEILVEELLTPKEIRIEPRVRCNTCQIPNCAGCEIGGTSK